MPKIDAQTLAFLRDIDAYAVRIRDEFALAAPGEIVWQAETMDGLILVEADGYGGGRAVEVEGNYPVDYITIHEQTFDDTDAAADLAMQWVGETDPDMFNEAESEG